MTYTDLPTLHCNREQLIQVFENLIGNAIKYRHPARAPHIEINANREGSWWRFSVKDNGRGFSMEYAKTIFDLFKRLHGQQIPGSGIGLALCDRIIEQHGGRIWAESEPDIGSTFHFTISTA